MAWKIKSSTCSIEVSGGDGTASIMRYCGRGDQEGGAKVVKTFRQLIAKCKIDLRCH